VKTACDALLLTRRLRLGDIVAVRVPTLAQDDRVILDLSHAETPRPNPVLR
jgi:hypothetical protein